MYLPGKIDTVRVIECFIGAIVLRKEWGLSLEAGAFEPSRLPTSWPEISPLFLFIIPSNNEPSSLIGDRPHQTDVYKLADKCWDYHAISQDCKCTS
jgi:hypothetical protein